MANRLFVFMASLIVMVIVGGCPPVEPELAEPSEIDTIKLEPAETQSEEVKLDKVEPSDVELDETEPDEMMPVAVGPDDGGPVVTTEPNELNLPEVEPGEVLAVEAEPSGIDLSKPEPNEPPPAELEPNEVEPDLVEPNSAELAKVEPNDLKLEPEVYGKCAGILKDYVDDNGMVDYATLRRKRLELKATLEEYNRLDPKEYKSWSKEDKIAFWINVYNLQKLNVVTDNYPIEPSSRVLSIFWGAGSIRHIEGQITQHKFLVMDEQFTFAEIRKRFFRSEFDEPRVFFAISDACLSSPALRNEPYYGHRLNEQLEDQTRKFLSSPLAFNIDRDKQKVYLSALFQTSSYGNEFVKKFAIDKKFKDHPHATRAVLNFITNYVSKQDVSFLEVGNYTIQYMKYNWTINDGS